MHDDPHNDPHSSQALGGEMDPDWTSIAHIELPIGTIAHSLFSSAAQVHTGWESCIEPSLVMFELNAVADDDGNHCRLVELEYEEEPEATPWHDWTIELKLGDMFLSAHWRAPIQAPGAEWEWCAEEARKGFERACILVGKKVVSGIAIEETPSIAREPRH